MKYSSLQLQELAWHKGSHSVTCRPAVVTSPPFPQQSWYSVKRPQRDARQSWASYTLRWYTRPKMLTHTSTNRAHTHKHTHTRLMALCPGLSGWASTRKVKPTWILLKQETVSGSGISWAICKSAPRSRQITTSAPHHADAAVETRIWIGWNKFRHLVPLLTNKDMSLIMRGRLHSSCVRSSMLHVSKTWPVKKENVVALQWAEMRMVRWMCGVKLR